MIKTKVTIKDTGGKDFVEKAKALAEQQIRKKLEAMFDQLEQVECPIHGRLSFEDKGLDTDIKHCCAYTREAVGEILGAPEPMNREDAIQILKDYDQSPGYRKITLGDYTLRDAIDFLRERGEESVLCETVEDWIRKENKQP